VSTILFRVGTTILDEIERVYDDITHSAPNPLDIEDWFMAERQFLCKPDAELIEKRGLFIVTVALDAANPAAIDILLTADDVLVQSSTAHRPRIFRAVHFPLPINPLESHATCVNGRLILITPKQAVTTL
jgi:hypothetical protein